MNSGVFYDIASTVLFGVSTPLAKTLVGSIPPLWLAALLFLGAGLGLLVVLGARWVLVSDAPVAELESELEALYRAFVWAPGRVHWDDRASINDPGLRTMSKALSRRF